MLVLSRQRDQSVIIGEDMEVRVVDVRGDKVRLGFIAPREVTVHRKEVYDQIRRENLAAAQLKPDDLKGLRPPVPEQPVMRLVPQEPSPEDATFLRAAVDEAKLGLAEGGLPVGAVLVRGGEIIGRGHDCRVQRGDPTAHAAIECLTNAGRQHTYAGATLYATHFSGFLCSGAAVEFGIRRVVVGDATHLPGGKGPGGSPRNFLRSHGVELVDLADGECIAMTAEFVRDNPAVWNQDIGR
jgi:cytosine/creatinine deaminase